MGRAVVDKLCVAVIMTLYALLAVACWAQLLEVL